MTDALNQRPDSGNNLVLSVDELKSTFLFGVSFLDDNGNSFPDSLFEFYIRSAAEWFQREVQCLLLPTPITDEIHDYYLQDFLSYGFLKLHHFPVRAVNRYAVQFPLTDSVLEFDPKWFKVNAMSGTVNLVPTTGAIETLLISNGGGFLPSIYSGNDYVPMILHVDYTAGFADGKIPADFREVIGMKAAMGPLNIAGDLLGGAGIASKSLSVDGLSESISTTSSPEFAGYGARINQYLKQIPVHLAAIKENLKGINMVVA